MKFRSFLATIGIVASIWPLLLNGPGTPPAAADEPILVVGLQTSWDDPGQRIRLDITFNQSRPELITIQISSNRPDLIFSQYGGTQSVDIGPGAEKLDIYLARIDGHFGEVLLYPDLETDLTIFVSYGESTVSSTIRLFPFTPTPIVPTATSTPTALPTETDTPTVTGTPPTATSTLTPRPTRTPTTVVLPLIRSISTQVGSRAGGLSRVSICLDRRAPFGGAGVGLTSSDPRLFPIPATVTVAAGTSCLSINVPVSATRAATVVTVSATLGASSASAITLVRPNRPTVYTQVVSRALGQSKVTVCDVVAAPAGGQSVTLTSDNPTLFAVPPVVTIPAGKACLSIVVQVGDTDAPVTVQVTANFDTVTRSATTSVRRIVLLLGATETPPAVTPVSTLLATEGPTVSADTPTATAAIAEATEPLPLTTPTTTLVPPLTPTFSAEESATAT